MKKLFTLMVVLLVVFVCCISANAQTQEVAANTDIMRSNGKIYVVMAVVVTIVTGLFLYVFSIDKKISKLENK
jgi:heme/copper-type cytochrome/quinol oxidase subunit 2